MNVSPVGSPSPLPRPNGDLDTTLSSTTPDVPTRSRLLPIAPTLGIATTVGLGLGSLLLRSRGAGWGLQSLATGAARGAVLGAGVGAVLLGTDRLTGGEVKRQLDLVSLNRMSQIAFVLSHPTKPWIAGMGLRVADDARRAQHELYGDHEPMDGSQDAFRHSYAAALFTLRAMRDHDQSPEVARELAIGAGAAHEADGQDNNDAWSREMDHANNEAGTRIVGDGRAAAGEQRDAAGFVTEQALRERVLTAISDGALQVIDRPAGGTPTPRATSSSDLPTAAE